MLNKILKIFAILFLVVAIVYIGEKAYSKLFPIKPKVEENTAEQQRLSDI